MTITITARESLPRRLLTWYRARRARKLSTCSVCGRPVTRYGDLYCSEECADGNQW